MSMQYAQYMLLFLVLAVNSKILLSLLYPPILGVIIAHATAIIGGHAFEKGDGLTLRVGLDRAY